MNLAEKSRGILNEKIFKKMVEKFQEKVIREYQEEYRLIWGSNIFFRREVTTPSLRAYEREFRTELQGRIEPVTKKEVLTLAQRCDLIYVGDFHPLRRAKLGCKEILEKGGDPEREAIILMEEFEKVHQTYLDDYLYGRIDSDALREKTGKGKGIGRSSWQGTVSILDCAREKGIYVRAMDVQGPSLKGRDTSYAKTITEVHERNPAAQLIVSAGDWHLARCHLPKKVSAGRPHLTDIIIHQSLESIFWRLLKQGKAYETEAVKLQDNIYCLNNTAPLIRALVYENHFKEPLEQDSSEQLRAEYKAILNNVIRTALGPGEEEPDLEKVDYTQLERIAYSGWGRRKTLREYKRLLRES